MKSITLLLSAVAVAAALLVFGIGLWKQSEERRMQLVSLHDELKQHQSEIAELERERRFIEKQRDEALEQVGALGARLQALRSPAPDVTAEIVVAEADAPEKSASDKNPFAGFLARIMEDPETKKLIREQQRMTLDGLYNPLIKRMNLTPEEGEQFKELLADNMMKGAEKATSMFTGESSEDKAGMLEKLTEDQKSFEETVRGFLGESRYAQYEEYQQTVGERAQLNQFRQTTGVENALSEMQTEQLLAFMREEKLAVGAISGQPMPGTGQGQAEWQAMLSEEGGDNLIQNQAEVNQRVYERARDVLAPTQLSAFGQFQTNQLQMMRMGMSMARKFMGGDK
jgi:hypothetical protein